jgi:cytoskeletal protein RodZ
MEVEVPDLRQWRQRKGISLDTIAEATKLSLRQLEAIETGNFARLPGGIYTTSYIRQYAKAVDFDEAAILTYYRSSCAADSVDSRKTTQSRPHLSRPVF